MSKSTSENVQPHCHLLLNALHPQHIKALCIEMITTYQSAVAFEIEDILSDFSISAVNIVRIRSYPIALICRFIQLLILIYIIGYIMWYKRDYQDHDVSIVSSTILKLQISGDYGEDLSIASDNALFIMTNAITYDQNQSFCAETMNATYAYCNEDSQCRPELQDTSRGHGHWTGQCRLPENRCEIQAWCPVINHVSSQHLTVDVLNASVLVQNFIEFPRFDLRRTNMFDNSLDFYNCHYDSTDNKYCPTFRIRDILELIEPDDEERVKMLEYGGVIRMKIDWICNLDLGEDQCRPEYSFGRLDIKQFDESFSTGFKFRYASHWTVRKRSFRTLRKVSGLRLVVIVNGDASRFDLFILSRRIGSMIGTLSLAIFLCDTIALYFSEHSHLFHRHKFRSIPNDQHVIRSMEICMMSNEDLLNKRAPV